MYSIYRKCIDCSHAKLLIIHENSCHCSFHTPSWTCSWPSYANAITLWLSIWSCVVNISREETLWVDGRDTHDPMPHTQLARKRRRVLCLRTDFSLISSAWNVFLHLDYWYSSISVIDWSLFLIAPQNLGGGRACHVFAYISANTRTDFSQ